MRKIKYTTFVLLLTVSLFAQEPKKEMDVAVLKSAYLDSIKATFTNHNTSNCIDERWLGCTCH